MVFVEVEWLGERVVLERVILFEQIHDCDALG